ncbi:MAG: hypothetical protein P1U42_06615 [Phycisphaerales bacterium]|nr:hypothetical protein [Phycisphaerales bacterium]
MLRNILAVIAGYITMGALVFVGLTSAYLIMGADKAFEPGTYEITTLWIVVMASIGLCSAFVGGIVCALISKSSKGAVMSLMTLMVILSGINIVSIAMKEAPAPEDQIRSESTSNMDAMMKAQTPVWVAGIDPIVGVIGVMLGAMVICPDRKKSQSNTVDSFSE